MIVSRTGFGIYLTDGFGEVLKGMEGMMEVAGVAPRENNDWKFYCPSCEEPQIVFGFKCELNKSVSVTGLEAKWGEVLTKAPKEMVEAWEKAGKPEPDFVFLSGEC